MGSREPIWQDLGGILFGLLFVLFGLTPRPSLPYLPGDVRASPEFNLIWTVLFVGLGVFFVVGFAVRLVGGLRQR